MKKLLLLIILGFSSGIVAQTIQSINPDNGIAGETLQVTITGNNTLFTTISAPENVSFYNNMSSYFTAGALDFISDTEMNAMVTIPVSAATGWYNLNVYGDTSASLPNAFYVTNNNNTITGNVKIDINNNGCDASDLQMAGIKVKLNNGTSDTFTFTDSAGNYVFYVPAGNYTVTLMPELPNYTAAPVSAVVNFPTASNLNEVENFCLTPSGVHNDLTVTLWPLDPARPGFNAMYWITYTNNGNQSLSGSVNLTFDDSRLDLVSAIPANSSATTNNLDWTFADLMPFETRLITVTLNVNSPMETPAVNINDILSYIVTVNPVSGDDTPSDNVFAYNQTVVGSFDPNDKAVAEGPLVHIDDAGEYLHYLIRFQNTGTFLAENVRIQDMLSENLDKSTLQVVSASHAYRTTLTSGNKLEFFFDNIMLPPESVNEPGSHGFVGFKIKPVNSVVIGSTIENTAEIYFDFNFPIVTNTVATTFTTLGNPGVGLEDSIRLYPNPAGGVLNIDMLSSTEAASAKIFNQLGQLVKTIDNIGESPDSGIAIGDLTSGTYYVQITAGTATATKKLVKL